MLKAEQLSRVVEVLRSRDDLARQVAEFIISDGLLEEATFELCERVTTAAFGARVECPRCSALVLPGFLCWDCEEWRAPARDADEFPF